MQLQRADRDVLRNADRAAVEQRDADAAGADVGDHGVLHIQLALLPEDADGLRADQRFFGAVLEDLQIQVVVDFELVGDERAVFRLAHDGGGDDAHVLAAVVGQRSGEFFENGREQAQAFKADPPIVEYFVSEINRVFQRVQRFDLSAAQLGYAHAHGAGADFDDSRRAARAFFVQIRAPPFERFHYIYHYTKVSGKKH